MSLKSQMAADVATVFHQTDDFAEEIIHYKSPGGQPETISAVVDYLEDSTPPTTSRGVRIKNRAILELSTAVQVTEERAGGREPSSFEIDGVKWLVTRIVHRDNDMQSVEIQRIDQKSTKGVGP